GRRIEAIPAAVLDALVRYPWPGNIREMQNVIERAVILSTGPELHIDPAELKTAKTQAEPAVAGPLAEEAPAQAPVSLADAEREHILAALRASNWVLGGPNGAAARLAMKRTTLQSKMKRLGIANHP